MTSCLKNQAVNKLFSPPSLKGMFNDSCYPEQKYPTNGKDIFTVCLTADKPLEASTNPLIAINEPDTPSYRSRGGFIRKKATMKPTTARANTQGNTPA
jgi:hypothetical protein